MGINKHLKHPPTPNIAPTANSKKEIGVKTNSKRYVNVFQTFTQLKLSNLVADTKYLSVQSDGPAGEKQKDRMGIFTLLTEQWNGKHIWEQESGENKLFYSSGEL